MLKVAWLALFSLFVLSTVAKKTNNEDKKFLWEKFSHALLYLRSSSRYKFLEKCTAATECDKSIFGNRTGGISWKIAVAEDGKENFWQTYKCYRENDVSLCPVDGGWSTWVGDTECEAPCGEEGNKTYKRLCNNPAPVHHGFSCSGNSMYTEVCEGKCKMSELGTPLKEAHDYLNRIHKGYPDLEEKCFADTCNFDFVEEKLKASQKHKYWSSLICVKYKRSCPIDGSWSNWKDWEKCNTECGIGVQFQRRKCDNPAPENGGHQCPGIFMKEKQCSSTKDCANNQVDWLSEWSDFSPCSIACGEYGLQTSKRICLADDCTDKLTSSMEIQKPCFKGKCPASGSWSEWAKWTECSAFCGKGRYTRLRLCNNPYPEGGQFCLGEQLQTDMCTSTHCNEKGESNWMRMPDNKNSTYKYEVTTLASGDPYDKAVDRLSDELFHAWSPWTGCSQSCDGGKRLRNRLCKIEKCHGENKQIQLCNIHFCQVNGAWSQWLSWSVCSVTCGRGVRKRYRKCDNPYPEHGGTCVGDSEGSEECTHETNCPVNRQAVGKWTAWSECSVSCGGGTKSKQRECATKSNEACKNEKMDVACNAKPCPVDGKWGNWGSWSSCSAKCWIGTHIRDRTCTDPSPNLGGKLCSGSGTQIAHCIKEPCTDVKFSAAQFSGKAEFTYSPSQKPSRYLHVYISFKPFHKTGYLFHRYSNCDDKNCTHSLRVFLDHYKIHLVFKDENGFASAVSKTKFEVNKWHNAIIQMSNTGGYMILNEGPHEKFLVKKSTEEYIDFDASMIVGKDRSHHEEFHGEMGELFVNFQEFSFQKTESWVGYGSPHKVKHFSTTSLDPSVLYTKFDGHTYAKYTFKNSKTFELEMVIYPEVMDGLIAFNLGSAEGSYMFILLEKSEIKFYFNAGEKEVQQDVAELRENTWCSIRVSIIGKEADIRVDENEATQILGEGDDYVSSNKINIGGGEHSFWKILSKIKKGVTGFKGKMDFVSLNERKYVIRNSPLLKSTRRIASFGRMTDAHPSSIYKDFKEIKQLKCDYSDFIKTQQDVRILWLKGDGFLKVDKSVQVVKKMPHESYKSALTLLPNHAQEGIYTCCILHDGNLDLRHVFAVVSHKGLNSAHSAAAEEKDILSIMLILMAVLIACGLIGGIVLLAVKPGSKLSEKAKMVVQKRLKKKKNVGIEEVQQPEGEDEIQETVAADEEHAYMEMGALAEDTEPVTEGEELPTEDVQEEAEEEDAEEVEEHIYDEIRSKEHIAATPVTKQSGQSVGSYVQMHRPDQLASNRSLGSQIQQSTIVEYENELALALSMLNNEEKSQILHSLSSQLAQSAMLDERRQSLPHEYATIPGRPTGGSQDHSYESVNVQKSGIGFRDSRMSHHSQGIPERQTGGSQDHSYESINVQKSGIGSRDSRMSHHSQGSARMLNTESGPMYQAPPPPSNASMVNETRQSQPDTITMSAVLRELTSRDTSRTAAPDMPPSLPSQTHSKTSSHASMRHVSSLADEKILSDAAVVRRKTSGSLSSHASEDKESASASLHQRQSFVQTSDQDIAVSTHDAPSFGQDSADSLNLNPQSPRKLSISVASDIDESLNNSTAPLSPAVATGNSDSEEYSEANAP